MINPVSPKNIEVNTTRRFNCLITNSIYNPVGLETIV